MKTYEQVVNDLGTTQAEMMLNPKQTLRRYISAETVAYLFDRELEVVELDVQMAYYTAIDHLTPQAV
jgi:hypothetical protein